MSEISISEASRRWNVSRSTIQRKIKSGELSVVSNESHDATKKNKAKSIDKSELIRVFGEPKKKNNTVSIHASKVNLTQDEVHQMKQEIKILQAEKKGLEVQVLLLTESLERERKINDELRRPKLLRWFGK